MKTQTHVKHHTKFHDALIEVFIFEKNAKKKADVV